jgi:eukaryotic-like serine/threonine-protein kinase
MARVAPPLRAFLELPRSERRLGPFVLLHPLGKGGFAPVWLAEEAYGETTLRTAAIKLFCFEHAGLGLRGSLSAPITSPEAQRRDQILEEARALCRVEHPNVVRFYALPTDEARGIVGLAMEHVAGTSLDERLAVAGNKGIPPREVLAIGTALASALVVVHQAGLVHRDLKPANVIDATGVYKLIDFGIASATVDRPRGRTSQREVVVDGIPILTDESVDEGPETFGTHGYVDPACVGTGKPATPASDLYGLGALLHECLTGLLPAADGGELNEKVLRGEQRARSIAERAPAVPPALGALVDALLDPVPERRPRSAEAVAHEIERIRQDLAGRARVLPDEQIGPFRGLGRFEEQDRDVFFGRSTEVASALEMLRGRGLVALIGPSGSGKSSLARAGVVPALVDGALGTWPKTWKSIVVSPGSDPWATMVAALAPFLGGDLEQLAKGTPDELADAVHRGRDDRSGLVIVVDQLEELATLSAKEPREKVVALLVRLGERAVPGVRTLVAVRRDLLDPIFALSDALGRVLARGTLLVGPMSDVAWSDALDQSLAAYGYSFEDDALRAKIVDDLRETSSAMPLVQFALTQLWAQRDPTNKRITRAGYEAIGGLRGALERHAEATLERIAFIPFHTTVARDLLLALTTPRGTRTTQTLARLARAAGPRVNDVVKTFEEARLLSREPDGYTLAHEALLTQWERLRAWVAEAREDRLLADELERDAIAWDRSRDPALLWRKGRLAAAEEVRRHEVVRLSDVATEFVDSARRAESRARRILTIAGLAVAAGLGASVVALVVANVREGRNSEVRAEADRFRAAAASAETARQKTLAELEATETQRSLCEARIAGMLAARKKEKEELVKVRDYDLANYCKDLRTKAKAQLDAPKPIGE